MKIWLDDIRPMPKHYDAHVKTASEAIELIKKGIVTEISLDHDLGPSEAGTGYDVAKFIEESAFHGTILPIQIQVHTANPVGRQNILSSLNNAMKFWKNRS